MRSTSNKNITGSAADRRRRKQWLLDTFGNGKSAPCAMRCHPDCEGRVTFETLWVDRYPVAGVYGGKYTRDNIRPSCPICNMSDGGRLGQERRRDRVGIESGGTVRVGVKTRLLLHSASAQVAFCRTLAGQTRSAGLVRGHGRRSRSKAGLTRCQIVR